ncbi:MAG: hypothetical protein ACYDD1_10255, partial [Caulobacteraceae bacterium]
MGKTSTRRSLVRSGSFLLAVTLNVVILALIARYDAPPRQDVAPVPTIVPVDLSQLVLPQRTAPVIVRKPASPATTPRPREHAAAPAPAAAQPPL